jgi:aspartate racemase
MKTIGILGGMSYESTATYYQLINNKINNALGGIHSAKIIVYSFDFAEIANAQHQNDWQTLKQMLINGAQKLEQAGSDAVVIATNTMHKIADEISESISVPLLHIVDAVAKQIKKYNIQKVGLLGTIFTMQEDFYKRKLLDDYAITTLVPNTDDMQIVSNIIYNELCVGVVNNSAKDEYLRIIDKLKNNGAQAIILGCTEIGMLINQNDVDIPIIDSTIAHCEDITNFALSEF